MPSVALVVLALAVLAAVMIVAPGPLEPLIHTLRQRWLRRSNGTIVRLDVLAQELDRQANRLVVEAESLERRRDGTRKAKAKRDAAALLRRRAETLRLRTAAAVRAAAAAGAPATTAVTVLRPEPREPRPEEDPDPPDRVA